MRIIDRYLLRQFLQTFAICYLSLTGLYVVFDAFTNLEGFMRCAEKGGGLLPLMGSFYGFQSILFFDRMSALLSLVAAMFTVAWIQRHNELTALMAAGVSRVRVVRPVIVAAITIVLLAAVSRELVIPRYREELSRKPQDLMGDMAQELKSSRDLSTDILIEGRFTFRDRQRISEPSFKLLNDAMADFGKQISAANAFYQPPQNGRPGGYLMCEVHEPKNIDAKESVRLGDRLVLITRRDAPDWLKPGECFVASDVTFEQLAGGQMFRQLASTWQLIEAVRNPSLFLGQDVQVAIHSRIVQPLLDVTLLFLGLPLVVTRHQRNVFIAIGMAMGVVSMFMTTVMSMQYLGSIYLYPSLAAWAPLMIFVPAAVALSESMWE